MDYVEDIIDAMDDAMSFVEGVKYEDLIKPRILDLSDSLSARKCFKLTSMPTELPVRMTSRR